MTLQFFSPAFEDEGIIPDQYTEHGQALSPPLSWSGLPHNTGSLALVMENVDAEVGGLSGKSLVHWILFNIPPLLSGLEQGAGGQQLPEEVEEGLNSWKRCGYRAPSGRNGGRHFRWSLYVLDTKLQGLHVPVSLQLQHAMQGHTLDQAQLNAYLEQ